MAYDSVQFGRLTRLGVLLHEDLGEVGRARELLEQRGVSLMALRLDAALEMATQADAHDALFAGLVTAAMEHKSCTATSS